MNIQEQSSAKTGSRKAGPIAGLIVALCIIVVAGIVHAKTSVIKFPGDVSEQKVENFEPISTTDHTRGNANAPLKLVEYSDLQCPFCKIFHKSMLELYPEYITSGKVFWAYRHFPLVTIHENAKNLSIASECVAKLGGEESYWKFINGIFGDPSERFDMAKLPIVAKDSGVNTGQFVRCYSAKETVGIVDAAMLSGTKMGISGTPYAVIITPSGKTFPLAQAYPAETLREIFDALAAQ